MEYTRESAAKRLNELLKIKGKSVAELEEKLRLSHSQIVAKIMSKDHGVIGSMVKEFNDFNINGYFHNQEQFGIKNGEIVKL